MSYFERWLKKVAPQSLQFIAVPALCLIIFVPLTIMELGLIGALIAGGMGAAYSALMSNLVIMDILVGGFFDSIILLDL
jgi:PTS system beta-glucosides-specific IIC component